MTPILKLFTAKEAVAFTSEGLECFGGVGYMENSGIPTIFRDS
jgi:alkylation response protein AidB-like acyl-CoA dehydrogenase